MESGWRITAWWLTLPPMGLVGAFAIPCRPTTSIGEVKWQGLQRCIKHESFGKRARRWTTPEMIGTLTRVSPGPELHLMKASTTSQCLSLHLTHSQGAKQFKINTATALFWLQLSTFLPLPLPLYSLSGLTTCCSLQVVESSFVQGINVSN